MNSLAICFVIFACVSAQVYRQPSRLSAGEQGALILRQSFELSPEGAYQYSYETENGISAEEQGQLSNSKEGGTQAQGNFKYTSPEGQLIVLQYIADENGFQPQGEHLPTPPPIPEYVLRAQQYIASHPDQELKQRRPIF